MSYCRYSEHCPWYIFGTSSTSLDGKTGLDAQYLAVMDDGWFPYREVLAMVEAGDVTPIGQVGEWHDFLLRIYTEYVIDMQEDHGPFVFGDVAWEVSRDADHRRELARAFHRAAPPSPRSRSQQQRARPDAMYRDKQGGVTSGRGSGVAVSRDISPAKAMEQEALDIVRRMGAWILSEPTPDPEPSLEDERLIFAAQSKPVRLSVAEVREIVTQECWWQIPGWDARWEVLLRVQLRIWLYRTAQRHRMPYFPWTVEVVGRRHGPAPELVITRDGRTCRLSPCEAREITNRGGWERIPGYEPRWQMELAEVLEGFWHEMDPPAWFRQ